MNTQVFYIILIAISLGSIAGAFSIVLWIIKHGKASKTKNRITQYIQPNSDDFHFIPSQQNQLFSDHEIGKLRYWVNKTLGKSTSEKLKLKLSSAYWAITATEYNLIRVGSAIIAFLLGWVVFNHFLAGVFLGTLAVMIPPIILDQSISKRQTQFQNQLLDVLVLIKGAVQAGYGLMQSLDLAVQEVPAPASEEFGRIIRETRLGFSLENALNNLSSRMDSDDLQIVVTAIIINREIGGSLATVLDAAIDTIRDRMQLLGEIRSLTSYAKYVGNLLTLMPFITGFGMFLLSPDYFESVKTSPLVQIFFLLAFFGVVVGNLWVRKIVQIKV